MFVQSVEKAFAVLMSFGLEKETMNLPEIAEAAGISKSAAQRFAFTLERLGYLQKDVSTRRYRLTPRVLELGFQYLMVDRLVERFSPHLMDLNRRCRESVSMSRPEGLDMVFVARFPSHESMPAHMPIGRRLPMYCTAAGRAYLSALPSAEAVQILTQSDRLKYTSTTVIEVASLNNLLDEARARGFSIANGEYYQGDLGLGVPILDSRKRPVAAVNIAASAARWSLDRMINELVPMLMEMIAKLVSNPSSAAEMQPFRLGLQVQPGRR